MPCQYHKHDGLGRCPTCQRNLRSRIDEVKKTSERVREILTPWRIGFDLAVGQEKMPIRICPKHDWNMGTYCAACRDEALEAYRNACIGGYKICNRYGPHSEPSCQKCQQERNEWLTEMASKVTLAGFDRAKVKDWTGVKTMKAPTEEQLRDPAWWDENAGTASHYCRGKGRFYDFRLHDSRCCFHRPTKPEPQTWDGEGLPPVGLTNKQFTLMTRISVACNEHPETEYEVVAHHLGKVVVAGKSFGREFAHIVPADDCRPIRTQAEREREELAKKAAELITEGYEFYVGAEEAAQRLYDAGMLRKGKS